MILKKYLKEIVYGGIDGIVTTFAVTAGFNGANLENSGMMSLVLLFGFANLFADAASMGIGNYLSLSASNNIEKKVSWPSINGLATSTAFIVFGIIPLLPYIIYSSKATFELTIWATICAMILLGYLRGKITKENKPKAIIQTLTLGSVAAIIAYTVGIMFRTS